MSPLKEGCRIVIVNGKENNDREGAYLSKKGMMYGWVLLDGEQEKQYFKLSRIRAIVPMPRRVFFPAVTPRRANVNGCREGPQEGPQNQEGISIESVVLRAQHLKRELSSLMDDIDQLTGDLQALSTTVKDLDDLTSKQKKLMPLYPLLSLLFHK